MPRVVGASSMAASSTTGRRIGPCDVGELADVVGAGVSVAAMSAAAVIVVTARLAAQKRRD